MAIRREFIDWKQPALASAARYLLDRGPRHGAFDLSQTVVVLPGARAGRRLLELLVAQAESRKLPLYPPREIVTAGQLPERLYRPGKPFAEALTQELVWAQVLRQWEPETFTRFVPDRPADEDLEAWLSLGRQLSAVHRELAADGVEFSDVVTKGRDLPDFQEASRWELLHEMQQEYLRNLDELNLWDRQTARLYAIKNEECRADFDIVLVGMVDLNRTQRAMLDQVAERVTALIFAPGDKSERFDEHGCLLADHWQQAAPDLRDEQIEVAGDPADQAALALRAIARLGGRYSGDQITLGVPSADVVPFLEQNLRQCGIASRYAAGLPAPRLAPWRLLNDVANYLNRHDFPDFAALVRHPAIEARLTGGSLDFDWLTELDSYYCEHLPVDPQQICDKGSRASPALRQLCEQVEALFKPLSGRPRPLAEWGGPILDVVALVFGDTIAPADEGGRAVLELCRGLQECFAEYAAVPASLVPTVPAVDALQRVLSDLAGHRVPQPSQAGAIELLGWLELPLDDAPALVLTGFNEGIVPSSLNADVFLPNRLRRKLGIEDNDRRYARDAYALSVLAASRESLTVITGRRTSDGDPLTPSRLLFDGPPEMATRRALRLFNPTDDASAPPRLPGALKPGQARSVLEVPRPAPLAEAVEEMSVTEFRDYLACPYRYYLRHRLKLGPVDDSAEELDPLAFGNLAHGVLHDFGESKAASSHNEKTIAEFLTKALYRRATQTFGTAPLPAVRVQIEQLRVRLEAFAARQAQHAQAGWEIRHVELAFRDPPRPKLIVDGQPMYLRGRIDRIDYHAGRKAWAVYDYKTGDTAKTPEKAHRKGDGWIDLQLPLYHHLVETLGITGEVLVGYIVLPKSVADVGFLEATWEPADFQSAELAAADVVRQVRRQVFWPPADEPYGFDEFAAICQEGQYTLASLGEAAE